MSEWRELPKGDIVAFSEAVKAGDEIEFHNGNNVWKPWNGAGWDSGWNVCARSKPKVRKIKILGMINPITGMTMTRTEDDRTYPLAGWTRYPKLDDEVEVPL